MTATSSDVKTRLTKARTALLLDHPWFGSLALRLRIEEKAGLGTMATDGTHLIYDPAFVEKLTPGELQGVIAHEVLHCALLHVFRVGARNKMLWNIAADLAINPIIIDAGMSLPPGCLLDRQYQNMSAEEIYARILSQAEQIAAGQPKPGESQPGRWGIGQDLQDPPKSPAKLPVDPDAEPGTGGPGEADQSDDSPRSEMDWQIDVEQVTVATKKQGKVPAGIARLVEKARASRTDWRTILHRFIEQVVPQDYSWARPNRRHIAAGQYLPGQVKENFPKIGVGVDTSGSIGNRELAVVSAELDAIMRELRPACLEVVYCDSAIPKGGVETFDPDGPRVELHPKGGGGTAFQPVFDYFSKQSEPPAAVVYFTDLYGPEPKNPGYPVLWVTSERSQGLQWFGELVRVELD